MKGFRTTIIVCIALACAFVGLAARCFYLQYNRAGHYVEASLRQQTSNRVQTAQRGSIVDPVGRLIVASNRVSVIFADPNAIRDISATAEQIGEALDMDPYQVKQIIGDDATRKYVKVKIDATPQQCEAASRIRGVGVQTEWRRIHTMGSLGSQPIGCVSDDNRGLEGIEYQYNAELTGTPGRSTVLADVRRRPVRPEDRESRAVAGAGIITTIDTSIQEFARSALLAQIEKFQAESAVAIVADPKTGAILASVSLPDYDPSEPGRAIPDNLRNRTITDTFEPGSVIKPLAVAIALDAGAITTNQTIFCEYGNYRGKGFGRIGEYRNGFGDLTIEEILIKSSNIGMAKIGQILGRQKLYDGLIRFGFGQRTGIDLPGEDPGLLWPLSRWTGYSETRIPFGQEITVTAMQLVRGFCILANGGYAVTPHVVKAVVSSDGRTDRRVDPAIGVGYIIKPEVAEWIVQEALTKVVNEGTGKAARLDRWQVWGKTGTANMARADGPGYSDNDYIASFLCGAPAEDPQIVVLVSVRKPNKRLGIGYTGGVVAAPVAKEIIENTLTYLERSASY